MTAKISTGGVVAMLDTPGLASALEASGGCELRIYAGAVPASADAAIGSATVLCKIKKDGTTPLNLEISGGVLAKPVADTWSATVLTSGVASFFRLVRISDDDALSTSAVRIQGSVAQVGGDVNLMNASLVASTPQDIKEFIIGIAEAAV